MATPSSIGFNRRIFVLGATFLSFVVSAVLAGAIVRLGNGFWVANSIALLFSIGVPLGTLLWALGRPVTCPRCNSIKAKLVYQRVAKGNQEYVHCPACDLNEPTGSVLAND